MSATPRVTLGIATYRRHDYLAEAVDSCLGQSYEKLEVLVVVDGAGSAEIDAILAERTNDPRLRLVRHPENRGIAEAYNTIVREGRGELIAMLGDDDIAMPDRIARQVEIFDRHPDTIVVVGDAVIVDGRGRRTGEWRSRDRSPAELQHHLVREHNTLVDPSRMVRRDAHERAGGYRAGFTLAQDFDFWLRALPHGRIRHLGGEPLIALRRHGENFSGESARALEVEQVEQALREHFERTPARELVPELDWSVLDPPEGERQALLRLAAALEQRALPLPALAAELRERAATLPSSPAPRRDRGRLLITAFGWNDSGGGTAIPRLAAKELVRRGWDVTVFHAATARLEGEPPYTVREWEEDGVRLVGVHNRAHGLWDLEAPLREVDDPPVTAAFAALVERLRPDVAHVHNLHNLGASLLDVLAARGVRTYFTTHNYWLLCPRAYLFRADLSLCDGPQGGSACASCVGSHDRDAYEERFGAIRERFGRTVEACMTVSHGVRRTLTAQGYDPGQLDVVRQCVPAQDEAWERVGRDRPPGRVDPERLVVAFAGSVYPHKGAQLLAEAAQRCEHEVLVRIHGEIPDAMRARITEIDRRGVVELAGAFSPSELPQLLAQVDVCALPSLWWDCAPLTAGEALAARVPLLAPRMGGLAEAIEDGVDGLAFDGGDADGLAAAIDRLAGEQGLLERLQAGIRAPRGFADWVDELEQYYGGARPGRIDDDDASVPLTVRWAGDQLAGTSLARINREVCTQLSARPGLAVERRALDDSSAAPPLPHAAEVEVRHRWPPDFSPPASGRLALIQPWEFGTIPEDWVAPLTNVVDELWVPSEYVRSMYTGAGIDPAKVHVVANGVDLAQFSPQGERFVIDGVRDGQLVFLFVGGVIWRKGPDVLLAAWREAFAGRDDVVLVIKDFGADGLYSSGDRAPIAAAIADPQCAPVIHLHADLHDDEIAALYRAAGVLVHPYRGEGFAMPVLEAMASGLPSIVTGGGPTDEFCPPGAGWRIESARVLRGDAQAGPLRLTGERWDLEPSQVDLVRLLREVAALPAAERRARGDAARAAAEEYGWEAIAGRYAERLRALARRRPLSSRAVAAIDVDGERPRLLAAPDWHDEARLAELLAAWQRSARAGTLVLLADPRLDGSGEELETRAVAAAAAAGVDLDQCADIAIRYEQPQPGRDEALLAACDGYIELHAGLPGLVRCARRLGLPVLAPADLVAAPLRVAA